MTKLALCARPPMAAPADPVKGPAVRRAHKSEMQRIVSQICVMAEGVTQALNSLPCQCRP